MKLTKGNIYLNLTNKLDEEIKDLYNFLLSNNERLDDKLACLINRKKEYPIFHLDRRYKKWRGRSINFKTNRKTEVTIEQLKIILKSNITKENINDIKNNKISLEYLLEEAKQLVAELEQKINDNKPNIGDVCKFWDDDSNKFVISILNDNDESLHPYMDNGYRGFANCEKITDENIINYFKNN